MPAALADNSAAPGYNDNCARVVRFAVAPEYIPGEDLMEYTDRFAPAPARNEDETVDDEEDSAEEELNELTQNLEFAKRMALMQQVLAGTKVTESATSATNAVGPAYTAYNENEDFHARLALAKQVLSETAGSS